MFFNYFLEPVFDPLWNWKTYEYKPTKSLNSSLSKDENNNTLIELVLPGVRKEDININVEGSFLKVSYDLSKENKTFVKNKRFSQMWELSKAVDIDNIEASCEDGVLTVKLPEKEKPPNEVRMIKIK